MRSVYHDSDIGDTIFDREIKDFAKLKYLLSSSSLNNFSVSDSYGLMPLASVNGTHLYFEIHGKGKPFLLIAGLSCDLTFWATIKTLLVPHFQLILFDNRCTGRSDDCTKDFTIEQLAEDAKGLLDHLSLPKAHILGHSMGGAIAQALAYHFPEKIDKVVFSHSLFKTFPVGISALQFIVHLYQSGAPIRLRAEAMMPWLFSNEFLADPQKKEGFIAMKERESYPISLPGIKRQFEAIFRFDPTPWYKNIKAPSLILCGEEDLICPPKALKHLANGIKGSQFYTFPSQAHVTPLEQPEEYCRLILNFLNLPSKLK